MKTTLTITPPADDSVHVTLSDAVRDQFSERSPATVVAILTELQDVHAMEHLEAEALYSQFETSRGHLVSIRYDMGLCVCQILSVPPLYRKGRVAYSFEYSNELQVNYSGARTWIPKVQMRRLPTALQPVSPLGERQLTTRGRWSAVLHGFLLSVPQSQRENDRQVAGMIQAVREVFDHLQRVPVLQHKDLLSMTLADRHDALLKVLWLSDLMSCPISKWPRTVAVRDEINANINGLIRLLQPTMEEVSRRLQILHDGDD